MFWQRRLQRRVLANKVIKEDLANKGTKEIVAHEAKWCSWVGKIIAAAFYTTATTKPDNDMLTKRLKASRPTWPDLNV